MSRWRPSTSSRSILNWLRISSGVLSQMSLVRSQHIHLSGALTYSSSTLLSYLRSFCHQRQVRSCSYQLRFHTLLPLRTSTCFRYSRPRIVWLLLCSPYPRMRPYLPNTCRSTSIIYLLYVSENVCFICMTLTLTGLPSQSLCASIPPRLQDGHPSHRSTITHRQRPTAYAILLTRGPI